MHLEIIDKNFRLDIYGLSGTAMNKDYAGTVFKLMDKMWTIVKSNGLKNQGRNIWIYEPNEKLFAGVELADIPEQDTGLEHKTINLEKYAYCKHIGPYNLIKQTGTNMINELEHRGYKTGDLYIEIYGHWTNDETKLETELFMTLK